MTISTRAVTAYLRGAHSYSIAVTAKNGSGDTIRSVLWVEAKTIPEAYALAREQMPDAKLGSIIPGHHAGAF